MVDLNVILIVRHFSLKRMFTGSALEVCGGGVLAVAAFQAVLCFSVLCCVELCCAVWSCAVLWFAELCFAAV
jgi:hypothetical protein